MDTIQVLIADDSRDFAKTCGGASIRKRASKWWRRGGLPGGRRAGGADRPEVVTTDIELAVMDGIEATREICSRWPEVRVVALTIYDRPVFREAGAMRMW